MQKSLTQNDVTEIMNNFYNQDYIQSSTECKLLLHLGDMKVLLSLCVKSC